MMSTIIGTWKLHMKTPVGTIHADYRFEEVDGVLRGTATAMDRGESTSTAVTDIVVEQTAGGDGDGQRVTWRQAITRPLRLNLAFDVRVTGDALVGESRAGRLPKSAVTGERATA